MQIKHLALAIMAASLAGQAVAGGFALSEQSVAAGGTANAGRASNVQDASITFSNPAAMHKLKQAQFTQALAFIDAQTDIKNAAGALPTPPFSNDGDIVPHTFVPSGYFTSGDQGGWAWGVAAYGSFGLKTNHEDTYAGRIYGDKSLVKVITVQPAVSYRVNDKVSVGFGPTINRLDAYLSRAAAADFTTTAELEGDDMGYGFNAGVHADLTENTSVGAVYRSKVTYKIDDGEVKLKSGSNLLAMLSTSATASLSTPESIEASLSHKLNSKTALHAGATWTRWSRLQDLTVVDNASSATVSQEVFEWKDSMGYAVGVTHAQSDKLELRAGLAYDNTPVSAEHRSVRLPSGDRRIVSIGAGYKLSPTQSIDVSYTYLDEEKVNVTKGNPPSPTEPLPYSADFKNKASIYGLQFTQKF